MMAQKTGPMSPEKLAAFRIKHAATLERKRLARESTQLVQRKSEHRREGDGGTTRWARAVRVFFGHERPTEDDDG